MTSKLTIRVPEEGNVKAAANDTVVGSYTSSVAHRWSRDIPIVGDYEAGIDACGGLVLVSQDLAFDPGRGAHHLSGRPANGDRPLCALSAARLVPRELAATLGRHQESAQRGRIHARNIQQCYKCCLRLRR